LRSTGLHSRNTVRGAGGEHLLGHPGDQRLEPGRAARRRIAASASPTPRAVAGSSARTTAPRRLVAVTQPWRASSCTARPTVLGLVPNSAAGP